MKTFREYLQEKQLKEYFNQYSVNADGDFFRYDYDVTIDRFHWFEKTLEKKAGKLKKEVINDGNGEVIFYFDKKGNHVATYDVDDYAFFTDIKLK